MKAPEYLSRGIDHLGDLGAKLRDLQGFRTLAHELIQNADDVPNATSMIFDVRSDSLVVDNDGVFSACRDVKQRECPWKEDPARGHRCDFHRFRYIISGDKRLEADTTGAFGIGFIAVYQITDVPELISAGRHWILHEEKPEHQRIEVCPGCAKCRATDLPGTRFILPWAWDPQSELRQGLRAEPVSLDAPERMLEVLERSLPLAMLFLKRLETIELKHNGRQHRVLGRLPEGDSLIVSDGDPDNDIIWHLIPGDFTEAAKALREQHLGRIEEKRSTKVSLAIPATELRTGLLYACLPTEHNTGLPFHINADFFPASDRKRVILADDYQSEWNREALKAGALSAAENLDRLRALLEPVRFWSFLDNVRKVADHVEKENGEQVLAAFWDSMASRLNAANVIYTTRGEWKTAADCSLLLQKEEVPAIPVLEDMGLNVAHEDLRPYQILLRSEVVGVPVLDVDRVCDVLADHGMTERVQVDCLPSFLKEKAKRALLWREIALLLDRQIRTHKAKADDEQRLKGIALAPARDGSLWPCGELFIADESTVALFHSLGADIPFGAKDPDFEPLARLCAQLNAASAIQALEGIGSERLEAVWHSNPVILSRLFQWFENRRLEVLENQRIKQAIAGLSIFPSAGKLRKMRDLSLPGNFDDPLGLAELVDLSVLEGRRQFLLDLGMSELDFRTYVLSRLPQALNNSTIPPEKRRAAVQLLASRFGEIRDDKDVCRALSASALIECTDGEFRKPGVCYFMSETVRDCLGDGIYYVPRPSEHQSAIYDLYEGLGVAGKPRSKDLLIRVKTLANQHYSPEAARVIVKIFAHLGEIVEGEFPPELESLRTMAWLPARGKADRWYSPRELYAVYRAHLFDTQAFFLDIPKAGSFILDFLGIRVEPSTKLVVKHLLHCSSQHIPVHSDVFRFLNEKAQDAELDLLKDRSCLLLGGRYVAPGQVFWGEHPFGRYRWRLSEELRAYSNLLQRLGVRDAPEPEDALKVLNEIAEEFGEMNIILDDEAHAALMACWQLLEKSLDGRSELMQELASLRKVKCIPNTNRILNPAEWMFFENRAGLAGKFGEFLKSNVIPRPLGAGESMTSAGVRPLGSAVKVELLECDDPVDDPEMARRILHRRNKFGRVLEAQISGNKTAMALHRLEELQCQAASSLLIRYRLNVFNRVQESAPETVPALYQREDERLLFIRRDGHVSWSAVARELAIAMLPDEDPGRIAAGLKEVLAAETDEAAAAVLDELGFGRLDTGVCDPPKSGISATSLGEEIPFSEDISIATTQTVMAATDPGPMTPQEAIEQLLGSGASTPTPLPEELLEKESMAPGDQGRAGKKSGSSKKKVRPVLRSYIPAPNALDNESTEAEGDGEYPARSPVDEAGVQRVIEYETKHGRLPREMPHKNPGYDVESCNISGKVVRYIEVKSFSGQWDHTYATLSKPQFEKAFDLGDLFWLYVVERTETDDFVIHRIQSPAQKANRFMFDDGWRATAEQDDVSEKGKE